MGAWCSSQQNGYPIHYDDTISRINSPTDSLQSIDLDIDPKVDKNWFKIVHYFAQPSLKEFVVIAYCHNMETSFNLFVPHPINHIILLYVQTVSFKTVVQARNAAIKQQSKDKLDTVFNIEKAIFKILSMTKISTISSNEEKVIKNVLKSYVNQDRHTDFLSYEDTQEFIDTNIQTFADIAMEQKREEILLIIMRTCSGNTKLKFNGIWLKEMLNFAASNKMYYLCKLLMKKQFFDQIKFNHRPQCLLNAFQTRNPKLILSIIYGLKSKKTFICLCNDVFKIEYMDCAECVVKYGWFNATESIYQRAVSEKNEIVLVMILRCHQYWRNGIWKHGHETYPFCLSGGRLSQMLCLASKNKMYYLADLLMNDNILHKIEFNARPECLLNAVQKSDGKMISMVLDGLKRKNKCFVCDDVFEECIITDNIECAKCIVELHWYTPTKMDTTLAQQYSKTMYAWLLKRSVGCLYESDGEMRDNIGFDDWDTENSNTDWNIEDDNWD